MSTFYCSATWDGYHCNATLPHQIYKGSDIHVQFDSEGELVATWTTKPLERISQ